MNPRLATLAIVTTLWLSACSSSDTESATSNPRPSSAAPVTETPLALTSHVIANLPGFKASAEPQLQDLVAFAKAHDHKAADLEAAGLVAGVTVMFTPNGEVPGNALSIAEQFSTPAQATTEAQRLFAANAEPDPGATATPITVDQIPGAQAVAVTGKFKGHPFSSVEIVYVEGSVVHELFAIGGDPLVDPTAYVEMISELHQSTSGHPIV